MKILVCAYREWALSVYHNLVKECGSSNTEFNLVTTPDELTKFYNTDYEIVIVIGWSWLIPQHIIEQSYVVGMHPSDLPAYAGGSPIQNQIIDGIEDSCATLFRLTPQFDAGPILAKKSISLRGHLQDVFKDIADKTLQLLIDMIRVWPNVIETPQCVDDKHKNVRRIKPEASQITHEQLRSLSCKRLWNLIRCREDPYPNTYIEDETGRLIIKYVEFEPK